MRARISVPALQHSVRPITDDLQLRLKAHFALSEA